MANDRLLIQKHDDVILVMCLMQLFDKA